MATQYFNNFTLRYNFSQSERSSLLLSKFLINSSMFKSLCILATQRFYAQLKTTQFYYYLYKKMIKFNSSTTPSTKCITNSIKQQSQWKRFKFFFTGLGYKVYTRHNLLYVWLGLTHYTCIKFPSSVFIFAKKRRMYIISFIESDFYVLFNAIGRIKKRDIYKGKGLLEVKSYKNFIRMKTGKKKQY